MAVAVGLGALSGGGPAVANSSDPSGPVPRLANAAGAAGAATGGSVGASLSGASGEFTPVTPARILDTRDGTGTAGNKSPIGASGTRTLQVTGRGGVAATNVSAVILNVTVTQPTTAGFLTVYPAGATRPTVSNLNFSPGQTVPNLVTVRLGTGGAVTVFNSSGATHVIADVVGYYATDAGTVGARFHPTQPERVLDTRTMNGGAKVTSAWISQPAGRVAVVANVTVTQPSGPGFVTAYPAGVARPNASNLNFTAGQTVPNLVTVQVGNDGIVSYNKANFFSSVPAHLIVDIVGYYDTVKTGDAGRFVPTDPTRRLDTRGSGQKRPPNSLAAFKFTGAGGMPASGVSAVVANVTVTEPTSAGYLTVYCGCRGTAKPLASNLNFLPGQTIPNLVVVELGGYPAGGVPDGSAIFYNSAGYTHVIADVAGYFLS
jgi:hypothetical protein